MSYEKNGSRIAENFISNLQGLKHNIEVLNNEVIKPELTELIKSEN
jgi:hypothetical protein